MCLSLASGVTVEVRRFPLQKACVAGGWHQSARRKHAALKQRVQDPEAHYALPSWNRAWLTGRQHLKGGSEAQDYVLLFSSFSLRLTDPID